MSKKPAPKPIFPLRDEFVDSLDNFIQRALNLYSAADFIVRNDKTPAEVRRALDRPLEAFRKAFESDE